MLRFAQIDFLHPAVGSDFGWRAFDEESSAHEDRDALGETEDEAHVVLDEKDRHVARQSSENAEELGAFSGGNTRSGLVEQQDPGPRRERQRNFDEPLL